jgi:hypothetical protein
MAFILRIFGLKVVTRYLGHWYVKDGQLRRKLIPIGWRLAKCSDPDHESEFERLIRNG